MRDFETEKALIRREVRAIVDKVLEMGDGDVATGTVRALAAGALDIPWSPSRFVKSRVLPARDADGYLRILDAADMPFPPDILAIHAEKLRQRSTRDGVPFGPDLAVQSVYELSEPLGRLLSDKWTA